MRCIMRFLQVENIEFSKFDFVRSVILNSIPGIVAQLKTNIPLMKGTVPKNLDIC